MTKIVGDCVAYVSLLDLFVVSYIDSVHLSDPCLQYMQRLQLELLKIFVEIRIKVAMWEMLRT